MLNARNYLGAAAFIAAAMALATPASAGSINITNVQVPYSEGVTLSGGTHPPLPYGYVSIAGEIVLTTTAGTLDTFCVDLFHEINIGGSYTYEPVPEVSDNDSTPPGPYPLTTAQIAEMTALADYGAYTLVHGIPLDPSDPNAWSAAIQAAIWDVEYGTSATGSDAQFALDLAYILGQYGDGYLNRYTWGYEIGDPTGGTQGLYEANNQQLFVTNVPEPTTIALFGVGLIGLGALRRRKTRKAA